jgi:hypothetical protein
VLGTLSFTYTLCFTYGKQMVSSFATDYSSLERYVFDLDQRRKAALGYHQCMSSYPLGLLTLSVSTSCILSHFRHLKEILWTHVRPYLLEIYRHDAYCGHIKIRISFVVDWPTIELFLVVLLVRGQFEGYDHCGVWVVSE